MGDPVEGHDQAIHTQRNQFSGHRFVQEEAIRADRNRQVPLTHQTHHVQDVRARQRFAKAAKDHPFQFGEVLGLFHYLAQNV
jgi:hypothetical protein